MLGRWRRNLESDRSSVFLEYAMLLAFVMVVGCTPIMPGGPIYDFLHRELMLRLTLISLPIL